MLKHVLFSILVVLTFSANAIAEGPAMKPGKWRVTTTTIVPMMGPMDFTATNCLTEKDMKPQEMMQQEGDCRVKNFKTSGSTSTWEVACKNQGGEFSGTAQATSKPESINGSMKMKMSMHGQSMTMETKWSGKYLGACDK